MAFACIYIYIYISSRCNLSDLWKGSMGGFLDRNCSKLVGYLFIEPTSMTGSLRRLCGVVPLRPPFLQRWHGSPMNLAHASHACVHAWSRKEEERPTIPGVSVQWQIVARATRWIPTALEPIRINQISRQQPCKIYRSISIPRFSRRTISCDILEGVETSIDPCPNFAYSNVYIYIYNLDMKVSKLTWNSINWTLDSEHL